MKKILTIILFAIFAIAGNFNESALEKINKENHNQTNFSFVVMGDNRDGDNVLEKIIEKINQDKTVAFAINNGDLVPDGYEKEYTKYTKLIKKSNKPIISVIGNHEIPWYDGETNYKDTFGKTNFAFSYGKNYFIILDTADKKVTHKQFKWLIKELKKSQKFTNRFVFTHVPLYDPREGKYKKGHSLKSITQAKELNDIFDKYNVTMLFCSHIHFYYRGIWQKTPFIITGGAGAPLKHYKNNGFYHYIKVTVNNGKIQYKVIRINQTQPNFFEKTIQSFKDFFNI